MQSAMNLTLVALDEPTENFAAVFTRNAFPGAPILVGRRRLEESPALGVRAELLLSLCVRRARNDAPQITPPAFFSLSLPKPRLCW